jgi:hypothetical protein
VQDRGQPKTQKAEGKGKMSEKQCINKKVPKDKAQDVDKNSVMRRG